MKKLMLSITIVSLLVLLLSSASFSQIGFGQGFKGGLVTSTFTGDDATDAIRRTGYIAGFFMDFSLGPLGIQPEVLYVMKGADFEDVEEGMPTNFRYKLGYIEIPVLAKLTITALPAFKLYVFGGPSVALLVSAKRETEMGTTSLEIDIKDDLKNLDVGLVLGVGVGLSRLTFDVRYTKGNSTLDYYDMVEDPTHDFRNSKNSVLAATVGISL